MNLVRSLVVVDDIVIILDNQIDHDDMK
jgi:hypothetical protein